MRNFCTYLMSLQWLFGMILFNVTNTGTMCTWFGVHIRFIFQLELYILLLYCIFVINIYLIQALLSEMVNNITNLFWWHLLLVIISILQWNITCWFSRWSVINTIEMYLRSGILYFSTEFGRSCWLHYPTILCILCQSSAVSCNVVHCGTSLILFLYGYIYCQSFLLFFLIVKWEKFLVSWIYWSVLIPWSSSSSSSSSCPV
jgi:hypothetical protein